MKFTIEREFFDETLKRVAKFAAKADSPIPIVSSIRLVATENDLTLTATDLDAVMSAKLPLFGAEPGSACVPAERLKGLIASLRAKETVEVSLGQKPRMDTSTSDSRLLIKSGHTKAVLNSWNPADFPEFDALFPQPQITVTAGELDRVLAMTETAMATDATHAAFFGLFLAFERDGISAVACDGHHGALCRLHTHEVVEFPSIILPRSACEKLRDLMKGLTGTIEITITPSRVRITANHWSVVSKLIDGEFPDHHRWMAPPVENPVTAKSEELSAILKRFDAVVDMDNKKLKQRGALAEIADGVMKFSDHLGAIQDQMDVAYTGPSVQIGLNTVQLRKVVGAIEATNIDLHIRNRESSVRVCAAGEEEESFTITPYRI